MGGQYHHELIKYCPPSYVLCVSSHFWPFTKVKFVLEKLYKNLGFADPRPPQLGQIPKFFQKLDLEAPLMLHEIMDPKQSYNCISSNTLRRDTGSAHGYSVLKNFFTYVDDLEFHVRSKICTGEIIHK